MQKQILYQPSGVDLERFQAILSGAVSAAFAAEQGKAPKGSRLQPRLLTAQVSGPGQFSGFALSYEIVDASGSPI